MNSNKLILAVIVIFFVSCKTQEDIRRERTMDNINEKIAQTQQTTASASSRFQTLEEQIAKLNGQLEEISHSQGQDGTEVNTMKERLKALEDVNKKQSENIRILADKVNEQTKYIEQVIKSLSELSDKKETEVRETPKKKAEKESKADKEVTLKNAILKFKAHDYVESKQILEDLLENTKINKKDKASSLFYLGMIEFKEKKYEEAKIYFSRLFTEIPDSSYSSIALLNLSKCFIQLKSKEEAIQTIDELIVRYPKSKEAQEAAKIKTKL